MVSKPVVTVQVRELVEFVLQQGDLGGGGDFVGSQRALAGTRGHQRLQRSRPPGYQMEVAVSHDVDAGEFVLRVQGRMDGLMAASETVWVEEIKTVQRGWSRVADPLHWAQAKFYGFIHADAQGLRRIDIQLTYLDLDSGEVTELRSSFSFEELAGFFQETTSEYVEWVRARRQWCQERDVSIRTMGFPFSRYRAGQRELAVAAYRVFSRGGRLFAEAPTGIGKTISTLFPAVKAMGEGRLERIFYLTARTVGRLMAEKAVVDLRRAGLRFRTLTLTAREKVCLHEGHPCDTQACPFALGYYDRNKSAIREALGFDEITRATVQELGLKHRVCPHELSLDISTWVDGIICDYNYVFDPQVYLRRHFGDAPGEYAFLVDEAHNLPDRAREMFSAEVSGRDIREMARAIRKSAPRCARALGRFNAALEKLRSSESLSEPSDEADGSDGAAPELDLFASPQTPVSAGQERNDAEGVQTSRSFPDQLLPLLEIALKEAETWLALNAPAEFREKLLELYFNLNSFRRVADQYDERFVTITETTRMGKVRLFCLDPSLLLREALGRGKSAVFFSATLAPLDYYRALLGGEPDDPLIQLASPFPPEHLAVLVQDRIKTNLKARMGTLGDVAHAIGSLVSGRRGNYLVYLPSYTYLASIQEQFHALHPDIRLLTQRTGMTESEREAFLEAFSAEHDETMVGFAVMGGIFGEGIDLMGDRLIGAIIVGVGLPQLSVERDLIRDYFEEKTGAGFEYAYTFPGMNRVLQAVGRVIRSETDRGVALLIDSRFNESRYRRLFPAGWRPQRVGNVGDIRKVIGAFWDE